MKELEEYQLTNMRVLCLEEEMNRLRWRGISLDDPIYRAVFEEWASLTDYDDL